MITVRVERVGGEIGLVLPSAMLERLKLAEGDVLAVSEVPSGLILTRSTPAVAEQIQLAEDAMARYAPALTELAK